MRGLDSCGLLSADRVSSQIKPLERLTLVHGIVNAGRVEGGTLVTGTLTASYSHAPRYGAIRWRTEQVWDGRRDEDEVRCDIPRICVPWGNWKPGKDAAEPMIAHERRRCHNIRDACYLIRFDAVI